MTGRNDPCWCGSGQKWKKCHYPQLAPTTFNNLRERYRKTYNILLKTDQEIEGIRKACRLASDIVQEVSNHAGPGVPTEELNRIANKLHEAAGARPASLHYGHPPFPKSICTSINEVICHGIPCDTLLEKGDIVNVDVASILHGYYGDCSRMVIVGGQTTPERQLVVDTAYECLMQSIEPLKPGMLVSDIGEVIERHAHKKGCSVVHQFVAHGVGIHYHEAPQIPHYRNRVQVPLAPGMTFTIEPMINAGAAEAVIDAKDEWTARTSDGRASAQWEHTILITPTGHEILTTWVR